MRCTAPPSPRSANGEAVQRSRGATRKPLLAATSRKVLHGECRQDQRSTIMPDTMGMVSTDEAFSIAVRGCEGGSLQWGALLPDPLPVVLEKSAM